VIVLLLFGTKRLKNIGSDLGGAIKGFKGAVKDGKKEADAQRIEKAEDEDVIEGEVTKSEAVKSEDKKDA